MLITGAWPRGAFDYMVSTFRWGYRVFAYMHLMVDPYPPFSLADDPAYPVRLEHRVPRAGRPLASARAVAARDPYLFVAGILYWITGLMTVAAFFTILFTKRIPQGVFELMIRASAGTCAGTRTRTSWPTVTRPGSGASGTAGAPRR